MQSEEKKVKNDNINALEIGVIPFFRIFLRANRKYLCLDPRVTRPYLN